MLGTQTGRGGCIKDDREFHSIIPEMKMPPPLLLVMGKIKSQLSSIIDLVRLKYCAI